MEQPLAKYYRGLLALALLALLYSCPVLADPPGQIQFTAFVAPKQSMTGINGQPNTVYLSWDTIEGELPAGIERFFIVRDAVVSPPLAVLEELPDAAELAAMTQQDRDAFKAALALEVDGYYAAPDQQRRRTEMIDRLNRELGAIDANNFAMALVDKLTGDFQSNALWLKFGGRLDYNLAQARRRAFRDDTAPLSNNVNYELIADFAPLDPTPGPEDKRIGEITVDTTQTHVMPGVDDFRQIELRRCDAPEQGKDQASVALSWNTPEAQVDEYRNALVIAGYDVYRETECASASNPDGAISDPQNIDIRAIAAVAGTGPDGSPQLPGLVRVNEDPVVISGSGHPGETEQRYQGYNPEYAQFTESPQQVADAGLKAGDICDYFIAPRDITGNYGATEWQEVSIPDLALPPAPWVIEVLTDNVTGPLDGGNSNELDISFDHVNVINYHTDHRGDRSYCNLATAAAEKELRYVAQGESCDTGTQHRVRLDIKGYNIFRFREPSIANSFQDSDGDGYGDLEEREPHPVLPNITLPGTACDANLPPQGGGTYYRVDPEAQNLDFTIPAAPPYLQQRADGRLVIEYGDPVPAQGLQEQTWWYRIQAVHEDGTLSQLSAPQRGLFHDVRKPTRDQIDCSYGDRHCLRNARLTEGKPWFGEDLTTDKPARWLRLSCQPSGTTGQETLNLGFTDVTDSSGGLHRVAELSNQICNDVVDDCGGATISASFLDTTGGQLGTSLQVGLVPGSNCARYQVELVDDCRTNAIFGRGDTAVLGTARGPTGLDCPPVAGHCYRLFRELGGNNYPLATLCDGDFPVCFDGYLVNNNGTFEEAQCTQPFNTQIKLPNLGAEPVCLSISIVNDNNQASPEKHLQCFSTAAEPPGKVQPLDFEFDTPNADQGVITLVPPQQPVRGVLVQYYRDEPGAPEPYSQTSFRALPDHSATDGPVAVTALLQTPLFSAEPEWEEQWCFRARTIGVSAPGEELDVISAWTKPLCRVRRAPGQVAPEYMPWPKIGVAPEGEELLAGYLDGDGLPVVYVGPLVLPPGCPDPRAPCDAKGGGNPCYRTASQVDLPGIDDPVSFGSSICGNICDAVQDAIAGQVNFVAYRQERDAQGNLSDFHQVSPLVPTAYCRYDFYNGLSQPPMSRVRDPLIKPLKILSLGQPWDDLSMVFHDRYPHADDSQYRYQFVYFDGDGEISAYRVSDWVQAVPVP